MSVTVRRATEEDWVMIDMLERKYTRMNYTEDYLKELLTGEYNYVAVCDNNIIGYLITGDDNCDWGPPALHQYLDEKGVNNLFTVISIAVDENYRNINVASSLFDRLFTDCKNKVNHVFLQLRTSNAIAMKLYLKFGFVTEWILKDYYSDPIEDAILMSRSF